MKKSTTKASNLLALALALCLSLVLGGCNAVSESSETSNTQSSPSPTATEVASPEDGLELQAALPEGLYRMQDGTILALTAAFSDGPYVVANFEVFNDQTSALRPWGYFDLIDEDGRRFSSFDWIPVVNLAPKSAASFRLSFRPEGESLPRAIAFGSEVSAVNNEIPLSEAEFAAARLGMTEIRGQHPVTMWNGGERFQSAGVEFTLNSVESCALDDGVALERDRVSRYFQDVESVCFLLDLTIDNQSNSEVQVDPFVLFSLYDGNGLVGLGTDTYDGPDLWSTLKAGQLIRGNYIFVTSATGPYVLAANVSGDIGAIAFNGP